MVNMYIPRDFVQDFKQSWPYHGLPDYEIFVALDDRGDLEDHNLRDMDVMNETLSVLIISYLTHVLAGQRVRAGYDEAE